MKLLWFAVGYYCGAVNPFELRWGRVAVVVTLLLLAGAVRHRVKGWRLHHRGQGVYGSWYWGPDGETP